MEPLIAIEGLDGSGKSTTVALLAQALGAAVIRNPPASLASERAAADASPPDERRSWYLKANRVAMEEARSIAQVRPVVLDRSLASTLSFGAAERGLVAGREDVPADFPLPTHTVFLFVEEGVRRQRHASRGGQATDEEGRLARDQAFRERVIAGYRNLCAVEVDAAGSPSQVVAEVLRRIGLAPALVPPR